jgi:hypothetical protein
MAAFFFSRYSPLSFSARLLLKGKAEEAQAYKWSHSALG